MQPDFRPVLSHFGLACFDVDRMVEFYTGVFDLKLTDVGTGHDFPYRLAFLSSSPSQHHQLALAQNRPPESVSTVMQLSFKVRTLEHLREARKRALGHGATGFRLLDHGNALSVYFLDPEGNTVEVYLDTPWYVAQPHADPLDLDRSDEQIWAEAERRARMDPSFQPFEQWSRGFTARLGEGG